MDGYALSQPLTYREFDFFEIFVYVYIWLYLE